MSSTTTPEFHAVLMNVGSVGHIQDVEVYRGTWNAAQAVFEGLDTERREGKFERPNVELRSFCVRSVADPRVERALRGDTLRYGSRIGLAQRDLASHVGSRSLSYERGFNRKAAGEAAKAALADTTNGTLFHVNRQAMLRARHLGYTRPDQSDFRSIIQDAVKARVIIGRDERSGKGYFLLKKDGPLFRARTADGTRLNQSTLAFRGDFHRLTPAMIEVGIGKADEADAKRMARLRAEYEARKESHVA